MSTNELSTAFENSIAMLLPTAPLEDALSALRNSAGTAPLSTNRSSRAIAFIDSNLNDKQTLIARLQPGTIAYELGVGDAIAQMTQILSGYSDVASVQIFSHGSNGSLQLGNLNLDLGDLEGYSDELQQWVNAMTPDGDILLYGCNVAEDAIGQTFVNQLSQLTGADVAASTDLTGNASLGGNWALEYQTGSIEASPFAAVDYQSTLFNFTVTTLNDVVNPNDGVISLREAINAAQALDGSDNIFFGVNGTINLTGGALFLSSTINIFGNGVGQTTISANNASNVFINSGGTVLLSGMTLTQGRGDFGGAIFNVGGLGGSLTVQSSSVRDNSTNNGAGIFNQGTLVVTNTSFVNNRTGIGGGSGIDNFAGNARVTACTFTDNFSTGPGAGIFNAGTMTVTNSTFTRNQVNATTLSTGGGIHQQFGSLTVTGCTFRENSARITGGGINSAGGSLIVNNSLFQNNRAFSFGLALAAGGGIAIGGNTTATVTGCTLTDNATDGTGGGISNRSTGTLTLTSNVLQNNSAVDGGGVFNAAGSTTNLRANLIRANTVSGVGVDLNGIFTTQGSNVIGKGGGFTGVVNLVNGDVILVP